MTELTLTLIKLAFLAVLWLFVLTAVGVVRTDLFGERKQPKAANVHPRESAATKQKQQKQKQQKQKQQKRQKPAERGAGLRTVVVTGGELKGTSFSLGEAPVTIGRANDSTLILDDDYASSRHARLFPQDGQWLVEDLGSTNGTFLDQDKVRRPTLVQAGTPIRIGTTTIELRR